MKKCFCVLFSLVLCFCLVGCGNSDKDDEQGITVSASSIVFFKTKNDADCALIKHNDRVFLIDTGEKKDTKQIIKKLNQIGVEKIDAIVFSHFDKDHCGGAIDIMESFPVTEIMYPQYVKDNENTEEIFDYVKENNIGMNMVVTYNSYLIDDIVVTVFPAQQYAYEKKPSNNSSLVIKFKILGKTALFTGDCQEERMPELIGYDDELSADILKLMYHGREVPNEQKMLDLVRPSYTVITAKKNSKDTKKNIKHIESMLGTYYYNTEGDIVFDLTGDKITVNR